MVDAAAVAIRTANPARCTQQDVLAVATRHKYPSSHEKIDRFIVAIAISRSRTIRVATVAAALAGSLYEPDQIEPGGFV